MTTTNKYRIIYFITLFSLSCIAIYAYTVSVVTKLDYFNTYQLQDSLFIGSFLILIYMVFSTVFITKITHNKWRMLLACLLYLIVLEEAFYNLAFGLRAEFGTSWASMDVRLGLVLYYEHTLLLLIVVACFYYLILFFLKTKTKNEYKNIEKHPKRDA